MGTVPQVSAVEQEVWIQSMLSTAEYVRDGSAASAARAQSGGLSTGGAGDQSGCCAWCNEVVVVVVLHRRESSDTPDAGRDGDGKGGLGARNACHARYDRASPPEAEVLVTP